MNDVIKRGMYAFRENEVKLPTRNTQAGAMSFTLEIEGQTIEFVDIAFVKELQRQLLETSKRVAIQEEKLRRLATELKKHNAQIRKLDK